MTTPDIRVSAPSGVLRITLDRATKALMRDMAAIGVAMEADRTAFIRQLGSPEAAAAFAAFAARKAPPA